MKLEMMTDSVLVLFKHILHPYRSYFTHVIADYAFGHGCAVMGAFTAEKSLLLRVRFCLFNGFIASGKFVDPSLC